MPRDIDFPELVGALVTHQPVCATHLLFLPHFLCKSISECQRVAGHRMKQQKQKQIRCSLDVEPKEGVDKTHACTRHAMVNVRIY